MTDEDTPDYGPLDFDEAKRELEKSIKGKGPARGATGAPAQPTDDELANKVAKLAADIAERAKEAKTEAAAAQVEKDNAKRAASAMGAQQAAERAHAYAAAASAAARLAHDRLRKAISLVGEIEDEPWKSKAGSDAARGLHDAMAAQLDETRANEAADLAERIAKPGDDTDE